MLVAAFSFVAGKNGSSFLSVFGSRDPYEQAYRVFCVDTKKATNILDSW
jgi:hypothetical protein